jgi:sec-independent protein translocase protein TatC
LFRDAKVQLNLKPQTLLSLPAMFSRNKSGTEGEMSFLDHLEALRWHLVRAAIAIVSIAVVLFCFKEFLFDGVLLAPKYPSFPTYRALCWLGNRFHMEDICISQINFNLISTDISAQFATHMWVSFIGGLVIGFPYLVYELWKFIKPALLEKEKRYARGIVFFTSLLFTMGILFGYYIITPMSVNFLGNYQVSPEVKNMISLDSFISTVTTMTLLTGIVFELPIAVYFLTQIGIFNPTFMRKYRRHAVVVILIVAAIITPTSDATTLLLVSVPLWILYEISIFVSAYVIRSKAAKN